jgi:hypothetical protein
MLVLFGHRGSRYVVYKTSGRPLSLHFSLGAVSLSQSTCCQKLFRCKVLSFVMHVSEERVAVETEYMNTVMQTSRAVG